MSGKNKTTVFLSLLLGGMIMLTACESESREVSLRYPLENHEDEVVTTGLVLSDDDFAGETNACNERIASLCAVMSASAFSSAAPQENFHELGFTHIAKFSYEKGYDEDTVGVSIASKKLRGETLVFIVARGTRGREWYSNFDVGYESEHKGFSACADFLMRKVKLYLTNYAIDSDTARFLITGYSRGAAAANILSKRLTDEFGREKVQAYTFATPNTTTLNNSESYSGIYNIIKPDDVFTAIPLARWGYHRYGTDIVLDGSSGSSDEVRQVFQQITGEDFRGFDSADSVEDFLFCAYELAPTVEDYYHKEYTVGEESLSVYEYMNIAAKFLCEEQTEEDGDTLMESMDSPFAEVSMFFMNGVDMEEMLFYGKNRFSHDVLN